MSKFRYYIYVALQFLALPVIFWCAVIGNPEPLGRFFDRIAKWAGLEIQEDGAYGLP